ncbi:hypothetical protein RvY_04593 [Ramazzottius varieornatus]|uniref:Peptidase S1 domain-containing protein n=1 Tax=Ramazzottius varieornatus TaxID=947166 RepID=A0A1D1UXV2_RAMVA|nr:hypothetical protein RvY_04593 [Ramazzottius varieornatus]
MEGDIGMGFLDVYMDVAGQQEPTIIFQTDGPHGKDWLGFYEQIRVAVQHSFRLRFIATRGKSFRSDIALDDIVVKEVRGDESCFPLAQYPNAIGDSLLFCDIDSDGKCKMQQEESQKDYVWNATKMEGYRFGTGPDIGDHTRGRYGKYLLARSETGEPGTSARLLITLDEQITERNSTKKDLCIDFYYMTFGRDMGELRVNLLYRKVEHDFITIKHATNRAWYQFGKILKGFTENNVTLVLEAVRGGSNMSDIAVDDVHIFFCDGREYPRYEVGHASVLTPWCRDGALPCPEKDGCILPEYLCDGVEHCINGSDEKFCSHQCGVPLVPANTIMTKIVYGQSVKPHSWPWQVALIDTTDETQFCGGSIIHAFWILTAAHCLTAHAPSEHNRLSNMLIRVGDHSLLYNTEPSQMDYYPSGLFIHPEFNKPFRANDFGLIRLRAPILFRQEIQPVCLPWFSPIPIGSTCVVTGWGHTAQAGPLHASEEGLRSLRRGRNKRTLHQLPLSYFRQAILPRTRRVFSSVQESSIRRFTTILSHTTDLQQLYLPIVPDEVCRNASQYNGILSDSMLCAGYLLSMVGDSCHGDSGGPLTCKRTDGAWEVHGVTSFGGLRCAEEGHPGIYARVVHALDWISQTMGEDARILKKRRADNVESVVKEEVGTSTAAPPFVKVE